MIMTDLVRSREGKTFTVFNTGEYKLHLCQGNQYSRPRFNRSRASQK